MFSAIVCLAALAASASARDAGILYEVWHTKAAQAMATVAASGWPQLTTELVIQSKGAHTLNDVYAVHGLNADIYNAQPELGFYCLYRARPGDPSPPVPDCANITRTAKAHAELLVSAGFDYVAVDITNWPTTDVNGPTDIAVLRPTEVLFEEWAALRAAGITTPSIAVWPCSPSGSNTWSYLLDTLYNNATYADLVYTQNGKKVVFLPDHPGCIDAATEGLIRANGGRNDVTTIPMWALFGQATYAQGDYGFFSPCTTSTGGYTTSQFGANVGPCAQYSTTGPNGAVEAISASGGYMLAQCSLPWASPGHLRGLTAARLFEKILADSPPHVFVSSFNEYIGGRQAPAYTAKIAFNQGMPNDPQRFTVWVDTYAAEFSRDIEPSVEGGNATFIVMSSCVRMYKAGATCASSPNEPCCTRADKDIFGIVWSLAQNGGGDYLTTNQWREVTILLTKGWSQLCSPIGGPSAVCVDGGTDGRNGPFALYTQGDVGRPTLPLYRCISPSVQHFISTQADCEGMGKQESVLGYIAKAPGTEMLRALYRCKGPAAGTYTHSLDLTCDSPDGPALGYVSVLAIHAGGGGFRNNMSEQGRTADQPEVFPFRRLPLGLWLRWERENVAHTSRQWGYDGLFSGPSSPPRPARSHEAVLSLDATSACVLLSLAKWFPGHSRLADVSYGIQFKKGVQFPGQPEPPTTVMIGTAARLGEATVGKLSTDGVRATVTILTAVTPSCRLGLSCDVDATGLQRLGVRATLGEWGPSWSPPPPHPSACVVDAGAALRDTLKRQFLYAM